MRRALEGLSDVHEAEVDLAAGQATVEAGAGVTDEDLVRAVEGKVILSWARSALSRLKREGR